MREELQVLSLEDRYRRIVIKTDIEHLASLEEISWEANIQGLVHKRGG